MTRPRSSLRQDAGFAVVTGLTTWVTLLTWRGFAVDAGDYLGPLLVLGLALTLTGALLRWLRVPVLVVPLLQLLLGGLSLLGMYGDGPLPTGESVRDALAAFTDAVATAQSYRAPVPADVPSLAPLLVGCGMGALIVMDLLAGGLRRVPASGLVLLMVYTLPVTVWGSDISLLVFVLSAAGFLLLLFLGEDERFSRWGRQIAGVPSGDPAGFGVRTGSARGNAAAIGGVATVTAVLAPLAIPTLSLDVFGIGVGPGDGGDVTIVNPMTDLRRDLRQGEDRPLVLVTTDQPDPSYLRYSVLTNFNGSEWTTGDRAIPDDQVANGQPLPPPAGLASGVARREYAVTYTADEDFESDWLPVPFPASEVTAPGLWKYDLDTMDFISGDDDTTAGLEWSASGIELQPTAEDLAASGAAPAPPGVVSAYTELPEGLPDIVRELAAQVTAGRTSSRYEQAVSLQNWFRSEGGFVYDLDVESGNGGDELETFLTEGPDGRAGYCEQFASAMAVMARTLQIPARVAVGFLRPERIDADTYVYSSRDLHAWPELYFPDVGWVRFEPTPASRTQGAPTYTRARLPEPGDTRLPSASGTALDDAPSASVPTGAPTDRAADAAAGAGDGGSGVPWTALVVGALAAGLLALLAVTPRTVRRSRRDARLSAGSAEAAWAELRDTAVDLGVPWPPGRSPRATGDQLAARLAAAPAADESAPGSSPERSSTGPDLRPWTGRAAAPEAAEALDRLVRALEVERYSARPSRVTADELAADTERVRSALRAAVSERTRRRADWLPLSVLRRSTEAAGPAAFEVEARAGDLTPEVEAVDPEESVRS